MKAESKERKKQYDKEYVIKNCKRITLMLNKKNDVDIIKHLENQDNKNLYIKNLIRNDMKK